MMRSPSPQLLRALRSSISTTSSRTVSTSTRTSININKLRALRLSSPSFHHSHRHNHPFSTSSPLSQKKSPSPPPPTRYTSQTATTKPATHDRGPKSAETTQTDFGALDVLGGVPAPTTAIDACLDDGFHLDNGVKVMNGDGCILVGGEVFAWRPWEGKGEGAKKGAMVNAKGQWEVEEEVWGLLGLVWPKPDILILGLGASVYPISTETRRHINSLGIRIEVQDTRNAAAQFNLLATERGVQEVAAAMIPIGWEGK